MSTVPWFNHNVTRATHEVDEPATGAAPLPPVGGASMEGLRASIARVRRKSSRERLLEAGAAELVESCNFDRVVISGAVGTQLVPLAWHAAYDAADLHERLEGWRDAPPVVTHDFHEGEILRRRRAVLAEHAQTDPHTYKPIMVALDIQAYVAAPITVAGHAVAVIHADRPSGTLGARDRAALALFAEVLGLTLERNELSDRIRSYSSAMRDWFEAGRGSLGELVEDTIDLARIAHVVDGAAGDSRIARMSELAPARPASTPLTPREVQVLEMIASGATNVAIGEALFISEETVKSHVQHILRKLGASNRAEAAARYTRG